MGLKQFWFKGCVESSLLPCSRLVCLAGGVVWESHLPRIVGGRAMPPISDELAVRKHLKVFIGSLPSDIREDEVGRHFGKYGQVVNVSVRAPREGDSKTSPYGFATFKFA